MLNAYGVNVIFNGVKLDFTFRYCDKADTITLFDISNNPKDDIILGHSVFEGCTNLKTINNLDKCKLSNITDRLFKGCTNLKIEPYYIKKFIGPMVKEGYAHEAFCECDFSNINYTVDLSDVEGKSFNGFRAFESSNINKFIYGTVPLTDKTMMSSWGVDYMFAQTPIEYCDLTGAGTLNLPREYSPDSGIRGLFQYCNKLNTLIIDSVDGLNRYNADNLDLRDKQIFINCTSLKTIIINDKASGSIQIDILRSFLSACELDADNIEIRFK